ncbi:acyl-CoA dehydrogenase family protein [Kibdelosporangium phytohabitans]|uniref:Acyl-CoA dehydrogenase n=1 Tax=Kibdelosporangium phytohabitans TaxID=860235 RepID=A0A0N9IIY1_9PSEU|nr:acyl-CoA dehydrogenase family protein [Kibdelosporangium phytohabitans]ALG15421.1 acyl-CoA dehydrogenase [Kibdelosporangium phytohabitans]MBE1463695.1 alkylation response protein AidB-like acyl-CoA dehydrogenase [Kibdelosporangium phytohabitans]
MTTSNPGALAARVDAVVGDQAGDWDVTGRIPEPLIRELAADGLLCAQVPTGYGGLGLSSLDTGELAAHVGSRCSSLRSLMTSQGMVAWTVQRLATARQRDAFLPKLARGELAAAAFSEPDAGSDLSAMATRIETDGDSVVVTGRKVWSTGAVYADTLLVFGKFEDGAAAVLVPATTAGVTVEPVERPTGCRAAGHANIRLDSVRLPADTVLGGAAQSLSLLVTSALAYGRISVAWGCVGILRACLRSVAEHARTRTQFGKTLAQHQLVARHLTEILVAEQTATRACEHASRCWDSNSPDMAPAVVLAKYIGSRQATRATQRAVQVLASAGAHDGHPVARAYRDAKLMEIIEGSSEICQLILADHVVAAG